ncbi:Sulfoacetaldehyde reductase [Kiritimatiella glycovorans]|uniref:Sulfoacetaldehyde reductase n=1 Tax=Kiritimatiella glycovorans TaxID=1307763 RepID=A0A0G3EGE9_9BACT|nr:Sulfoacetaldehyde reductase [Kiritimatiella glycovorans]
MKAAPVEFKSVLITGCSSGIGRAAARMLKTRGWEVLPTARKEEDLASLREEGFSPRKIELADEDSVSGLLNQLQHDGRLPGALVNNAGYGQPGAIEDLNRELLRRQFEVNVFGLQQLANGFVPSFRKRGCGRIVHVSSMLGRLSMPLNGAYSASKFALESLADAQRVELHDSGVAVSLIEPGPIYTEFHASARRRGSATLRTPHSPFLPLYEKFEHADRAPRTAARFALPPEAVARKIVHALESPHPRIRYRVTIPALLGEAAQRLLPACWIDAAFRAGLRRFSAAPATSDEPVQN